MEPSNNYIVFVLQVIPQLIARIDSPRRLVSKLIHELLTDVGRNHPQVKIELIVDTMLIYEYNNIMNYEEDCISLRIQTL